MLIKAEQKYLRMSPQKLRYVVDVVKRIKDPEKMIQYLAFVNKRASRPFSKVLKQAVANARNTRNVGDDLVVREVQIGEGPRLKRWRAGPRGGAKPILKKTSHVRVILEVSEVPKVQKVSKEEKEEQKK